MAIDVKNIQVGTRRYTELSIAYINDHPIPAGIISFLLFIYVFVRSLFVFLFFTIPIFIFIAVAFRLIFHIHQQNLKNVKGDTSFCRKSTPKICYLKAHARSVRRRTSKKNENRVHFQDDTNEKSIIFSTLNDNNLVDKDALVEETPKETREVEIEPISDILKPKIEGGNSDEERENAPNENKAVEWFSETEGNKRLKGLIVKRKARKLLTLQVRKTLMNMGRAEPLVLIPKINIFDVNKLCEGLISPTPGSAPSIMFPGHDPFDIPYDPQEEKPNINFREDLMGANYNDAVFCRHESFSLGKNFSGPWEMDGQDESSHRPDFVTKAVNWEIPEFSRFKDRSDNENLSAPTKIETSNESELMEDTNSFHDPNRQTEAPENSLNLNKIDVTNEAAHDPKIDTYDIRESTSSSSSELNAPFSKANKDEILRSISFSVRKNTQVLELETDVCNNENPSQFKKKRGSDPFFYSAHTRTQSLAFDLHVEVSEVGSEITNLSSDQECPECEMEGDFGNDENWVDSSELRRVEENEARSREVCEVSEQDMVEVGFSRINQNIEEMIELESYLGDFIEKFHDEDILLNEDLDFHQSNVGNPEEPSDSAQNIANDINDQVVNDDQGIIDLIQDTYGEDLDCIEEGTWHDLSSPTLIDNAQSVDIIEENYTQPENNNSNFLESLEGKLDKHSEEPAGVSEGFDFSRNNNNQVRDVAAENGPSEASSSASSRFVTENKIINANVPEIHNSSNEHQNELPSLVTNDSDGNYKFNPDLVRPIELAMFLGIDPAPIAVIPEATVEPVEVARSPLSSPNSVLQHKFSVDNIASNMSFDDIQMGSLQFNPVTTEQNGNFLEDSTVEQILAGDSVGLQESSFPLSRSSEDNTNNATEDEIVITRDNQADIGLLTPMKEDQNIEILKGMEENEELLRSNKFEGNIF